MKFIQVSQQAPYPFLIGRQQIMLTVLETIQTWSELLQQTNPTFARDRERRTRGYMYRTVCFRRGRNLDSTKHLPRSPLPTQEH